MFRCVTRFVHTRSRFSMKRPWQRPASSASDCSPGNRRSARHNTWCRPESESSSECGEVIAVDSSSDDSPLFPRSGARVLVTRPPVVIDISYDALLANVRSERLRQTHLTKFEVDGRKEERILAALQRPRCKKSCLKNIDPGRARALCTMWHSYFSA